MCSRVRAILNKNRLLIKTHNRAPWFPHFFVNFLKDIEKCNLMACVFAYLCNLLGQEFLPNLSTEGEKFKSCEYQFFKRPPVQVKHIFLEISPDQAMKGLSAAMICQKEGGAQLVKNLCSCSGLIAGALECISPVTGIIEYWGSVTQTHLNWDYLDGKMVSLESRW